MFALIVRVQLALDGLDRLVALLEERGPLPAVEAARLLFATPSIPTGMAASLLEEVCAGDSRVVCAGAIVSLAGAPDPLLEEAEFVVFDLETTGLSAQTSRICEVGAVRVGALELVDSLSVAGRSRSTAPGADGAPDRAPRRGAPPGAARLDGCRALPRVRRRRAARRAQRALRPELPRAPAAATGRAPARGAAARARRRSPAGCSAGACARWASPRSPTSSAWRPQPCHRALPDAEATAEMFVRLIGLAQELRRAPGLRAAKSSPRPASAACTASARLVHGAPDAAGRLPLPRPARAGALRRQGARPARAAALVLPERAAAPLGRGGAATRSSGSSGACSAPSSRRRSRRCG